MKRLLFVVLAAAMFVACTKDTGAAEKQMTEYKAQWSEITSLLDAEAVDAEGFDAWYNTLTNSEVRDLYAAVDELSLSYEEAEHWYKNLSDAEQQAVRTVAEAWEVENPALQLQVELFAENLLGVKFKKDDCPMPLLKVYYPETCDITELDKKDFENIWTGKPLNTKADEIQLNDKTQEVGVNPKEIVVNLRVDKEDTEGKLTAIKQELRTAEALSISYTAMQAE